MSHFTVLVIGDNVEAQLQPYHEFECTGTDDQYVQDIDQTADVLEEYKTSTKTMLRLADGTMADPYDDQFYREPTQEDEKIMGKFPGTGCGNGISWDSKDWGDGKGHRAKVHFKPEGAEAVKVPLSEARDIADWLEGWYGKKVVPFGQQPDLEKKHKYGYALVDEHGNVTKVVDRTNPQKKWDWWVIGGRWSGFLKLKPGSTGTLGERGLIGSCADDCPGRADQARKGDIDFEGMRSQASIKAADAWDRASEAHQGATWVTWEHARETSPSIDAARAFYGEQAPVKALRAMFDHPFHNIDQYLTPRDQFIQQARDRALSTYAVVKDSQWLGKGEMGWFGVSINDATQDEWNRKVNELLDSLPDDTLLTIADCHI